MLKDFFNHLWLVDKADDPHLSLALGASERVGLASCSWDCWIVGIVGLTLLELPKYKPKEA